METTDRSSGYQREIFQEKHFQRISHFDVKVKKLFLAMSAQDILIDLISPIFGQNVNSS